MYFVPIVPVAHVLVSVRVAFVTITPDTPRALRQVGAFDGVVVVADRKIVRPSFCHGAGLHSIETTGTDLGAHQTVGNSVPVLVQHHLAVVVGIQIVVQAGGAARKEAHVDLGRRAFRGGPEVSVVSTGCVGSLRFGQHAIVAHAASAEVVRLVVSRHFVEAQAVIVVVRHVDEIEQVGHRGGLIVARILPGQAVGEGKIEKLRSAEGPAV